MFGEITVLSHSLTWGVKPRDCLFATINCHLRPNLSEHSTDHNAKMTSAYSEWSWVKQEQNTKEEMCPPLNAFILVLKYMHVFIHHQNASWKKFSKAHALTFELHIVPTQCRFIVELAITQDMTVNNQGHIFQSGDQTTTCIFYSAARPWRSRVRAESPF